MLNLQAFADDSWEMGENGILVIAGYLNSSTTWRQFEREWKAELSRPPTIEYLKTADANGLRGQFGGWKRSEMEGKLQRLVAVIQNSESASFHLSLDLAHFKKAVTSVAPRGLGRPHFPAIFATICMLANGFANTNIDLEFDFVFDNQEGVDADLTKLYYFMLRNLEQPARKLVPRKPVFGNDREHMGLQAADLLAWNLRKFHGSLAEIKKSAIASKLIDESRHYYSKFDNAVFDRWGDAYRLDPKVAKMQSRSQWNDLMAQTSETDYFDFLMNQR